MDDTVALVVLQVPEPVIAEVPLPVRQPASVDAPVPPLATDKPVPDQLELLTDVKYPPTLAHLFAEVVLKALPVFCVSQ